MRGAVAAGHPLTAQAGADVLAAGGNAVDAAVAAALVSWVTESPLTGPGSGGFMLVHRARDRSTRVFDFFVAIPGLGDAPELALMDHVDVDFSGGSTQRFHIGAASCAIPGAALGLETAHKAFGRLPWRDLFQPAVELARTGVELNEGQAYLHRILDLIMRHTPEARDIYEHEGGPLGVGKPGTADAIDALARVMREQLQAPAGRGLLRALELGGAVVTRGTTHISVIDGRGNAVALTASTGAGSGVVVPGTGIHMNNMIGEFDIARKPRPGARLSSGMSPSLVLRDNAPHVVVGSAGSLRLRGAVLQVVVNTVGHGLSVEEAID